MRDGEGATKFVTVRVEGGKSVAECRKVAYAIAHSPLVKTAFFASDPNLGRILAAVGYSGVDVKTEKVDLYLDDVLVGEGRRAPSRVPGRAGRGGDEEAGVHGARGAEPRQGGRDGVDLRLLLRLRENQRRVPT